MAYARHILTLVAILAVSVLVSGCTDPNSPIDNPDIVLGKTPGEVESLYEAGYEYSGDEWDWVISLREYQPGWYPCTYRLYVQVDEEDVVIEASVSCD